MNFVVIMKREFRGYFETPIAYVFIAIFLVLSGVFTFYLGNFYERQQADLIPFFSFHPWLYLFLIPAISMRLWSEERKSGTLELLMTLPLSRLSIVFGKFLAAWMFSGVFGRFAFGRCRHWNGWVGCRIDAQWHWRQCPHPAWWRY